jgi:hypothetical protein
MTRWRVSLDPGAARLRRHAGIAIYFLVEQPLLYVMRRLLARIKMAPVAAPETRDSVMNVDATIGSAANDVARRF